ncbi:uncharacterized protein SOCG_03130 [Schizosaccharomyces octosporus yFS286]|uniref:Uncharacterized protein n=1 Tax=Schizosaccharomyces octosporus (strain yFS286) TaxID=483514 RepID=S9Q176_SCHOY|nr:uncharacterized protein SOCG_03130 [Schizosaccharomyces octosporus yFS286]EPX73912.1 hypothetical protein SOCG_03130 [Schizosaccharomyces octosporus yFS286]
MISTIRIIEDKQCQNLIEKKTEEYESTRVKDITQLITSDEAVSLMSVDTTNMKTVMKIENLIKNVLQFIQEKNQAMFNLECKLICSKYAFQMLDSNNKALQTEHEQLKESENSMKVKIFQNEHKIKPLVDKQKELEMDIFQLTTEKKMQQLKIQQQDKEIFSLASQCDRLKRRLNAANEDNYKHQRKLAILKDDLKAKEEENKHLYKERKSFIANIDRANFEAEQMKYQLEKHSEEDMLTKTSIENLSKMINVIRSDCQKVEEENRVLNIEKSQTTQRVLALENDLEELEITCQTYKEEIEISKKANEDLKKILKGRKQLHPIPEEVHTFIPNEEYLETERQRKLLKKIEEEKEKEKDEEHEVKEKITIQENKYEEVISALDKSQQECITLKEEMKVTENRHSELKEAMKNLEIQNEQAIKDNEKLISQINDLTQQNDSIKENFAKSELLQEKYKDIVKKFKDLTLEHARQTVKAESLALKCQKQELELKEKEGQWKKSSAFRLQEIKSLNGRIHDQCVQLEALQKSNDNLLKQMQEKPDNSMLETLKMTLLVRQKHVSFLEKENQKLQKLSEVQKQRYHYYLNFTKSISNERIHYYENEIRLLQDQIYMFTLEVQNSEIQRGLTNSEVNKSGIHEQNTLANNQTIIYMSAFELRNSHISLQSQEDKENISQRTSKGERSMNSENVQRSGLQNLATLDKLNIKAIETPNQNYDETNLISGNELSKEMVDDEYELEFNEEEPTINANEEDSANQFSLFYSEEERSQLPGFIADAKPANYDLFPCCQGAPDEVSNKNKELSKKKLVHQIFRS